MRDTFEPYPIHGGRTESALLADRDVDSNKLLRDRDGGLWIGTHGLGLIHVHDGRTDLFAKSDGLAGNISCSLFEDLDRNIWVATSGGLQRFRELAVKTASAPIGRSHGWHGWRRSRYGGTGPLVGGRSALRMEAHRSTAGPTSLERILSFSSRPPAPNHQVEQAHRGPSSICGSKPAAPPQRVAHQPPK